MTKICRSDGRLVHPAGTFRAVLVGAVRAAVTGASEGEDAVELHFQSEVKARDIDGRFLDQRPAMIALCGRYDARGQVCEFFGIKVEMSALMGAECFLRVERWTRDGGEPAAQVTAAWLVEQGSEHLGAWPYAPGCTATVADGEYAELPF